MTLLLLIQLGENEVECGLTMLFKKWYLIANLDHYGDTDG